MPHKSEEARRAWHEGRKGQENAVRRQRYAVDAAYREKLQALNRARASKRRYGITLEQVEQLRIKQGGRCALCGEPPSAKGLCVDHDHATGRVRGLLCNGCNVGLGYLGDTAEGLRRALRYVENAG